MPRQSPNKQVARTKKSTRSATKNRPGSGQSNTSVMIQGEEFPPKLAAAFHVLPPLLQRFVLMYVGEARGNAVLAAKLAKIPGTYATQASRASQYLRKPAVRAAINAWMETYAMSAAELTWRLKDLTEANPGPFTEWKDGKATVSVTDEVNWERHKHWVKRLSADPKTGQITDLELHDPVTAYRELAKIMKLYSDQPILAVSLQVRGMSDEDLLAQLAQARKLAAQGGQEIAVIPPPQQGA